MPNTGSLIKFLSGLKSAYTALATKDANTLYFCTDTQQLYLGDKEYTKSNVGVLSSAPNEATAGEYGKIYYCSANTSIYMCSGETDGDYSWTRVANINDKNGTVTSITAGDGMTGGTITGTGTIAHAVPSGATAKSVGDTANQTPGFGGTFKAISQTTDKFGHTTATGEHTVKIPDATFTPTAKGLVPIGGSAATFLRGDGTWVTPTDNDTTYTISSPSAGQVAITPKGGSAQTVTISGWSDLATKDDISSVFKFKGTVATASALPTTGQIVGDVYHVTADDSEYVYTEDGWEELGLTVSLSGYATESWVGTQLEGYIPKVTGETGEVAKFKADGTIESTGFTLGKSVPSDAKFTDTTYETFTSAADGLVPKSGSNGASSVLTPNGWKSVDDLTTDLGADRGLSITGGKVGHANSAIDAKTSYTNAQTPVFGGTFSIETVQYDEYGHITGSSTANVTIPSATASTSRNGLVPKFTSAQNNSHTTLTPSGWAETSMTAYGVEDTNITAPQQFQATRTYLIGATNGSVDFTSSNPETTLADPTGALNLKSASSATDFSAGAIHHMGLYVENYGNFAGYLVGSFKGALYGNASSANQLWTGAGTNEYITAEEVITASSNASNAVAALTWGSF